MPLRSFLSHLEHDPDASRLADEGGSAFVSQSLRPFLLAALADRDVRRPTVVVAGDDRAARDLAADLRAWLRPRAGALLPEPRRRLRVAPHAAAAPRRAARRGARRAARTPAEGSRAARSSSSAPSRCREKVPDPKLRPHGFTLRVGELLDLDEAARGPRGGGLRARRPGRGPRPVRGPRRPARRLPGHRGARRPRRPLRRRDRVAALVLHLHPALARRGRARSRSRRPPSSRPSTASWPRSPRWRAPTSAPTSPSCCPSTDFRELLDLVPDRRAGDRRRRRGRRAGAARPLGGRLRRLPRHRRPPPLRQARRRSSRRSSAHASRAAVLDQRLAADRDPRAGGRVRRALAARGRARAGEARRARATRTVVAWPQRGAAERAAYNLGRAKAQLRLGSGRPERAASSSRSTLRDGFVAPQLQARGDPRAPADPPPQGDRRPSGAQRGRGLLRSFTDLRTGDIVVHEDHGVGALRRLRHQDGGRGHARLPRPRVRRAPTRSSCRSTSSRRSRATSAPTARHPALSKLGGTRWDTMKARARRAAQELAGELLNLYAERKRRRGHAFEPDSDWLREFEDALPVPRDARPARGDRGRQGRHGVRAPDGPPDLRRRRLRQDRGRAARGVQGRQRRQAGADARADDDPRPAALRHLHRAPARLPVHDRARLALPRRPPSSGRRSSASPRARSTSSSAPTGCSRATCARRTSGC